MEADNLFQTHCHTTYTDLPVEIWTKILLYLKPSNIIQVQNFCPLWFAVIQNFIAEGRIKSDAYVSNLFGIILISFYFKNIIIYFKCLMYMS